MGGSQKSKRVTWASDVNLCQVKLFLSEDSPSQVGIGTQDHLQAKALWSVSTGGMGSDDSLPPGFEGVQPANPWLARLSQIPLIKWKCPLRLVVNIGWQVVAGDESTETETQTQREMRVLEAIYPRQSSIPPNPSELVGADNSINNQYPPVVPITPIEDEDITNEPSFGSSTNSTISQPQHSSLGNSSIGVEPDILAAAQAALTSVMSNATHGSSNNNNLIDRGLLIKILSDPKMVEHLVSNHANAPSSSTQNMPAVGSQNFSHQMPLRPGIPAVGSNNVMPNVPSTSGGQYIPNLRPPLPNSSSFDPTATINRQDPHSHVPAPFYPPASSPSVAKDVNYYKSLIQQHGGERRENTPQFGPMGTTNQDQPSNMMTTRPRDSKRKIMKPCIYFNSPRGCRNGANCSFQHDVSTQQRVSGNPDVQSTKRVKLDSEITGS